MMDGTQGIVVSVIVLTYDHASTIGRALESILAQEVEFPYEVLVGDDGSTDGTAEIVRAYADRCPQRIVPVLRKENIGATKNLYDLLQRAKGIYEGLPRDLPSRASIHLGLSEHLPGSEI